MEERKRDSAVEKAIDERYVRRSAESDCDSVVRGMAEMASFVLM